MVENRIADEEDRSLRFGYLREKSSCRQATVKHDVSINQCLLRQTAAK